MIVEIINDVELDQPSTELLQRAVAFAVQVEAGGTGFEVCLTLTNGADIAMANKGYRGVDAPTDVLSFPLLEFDGYADGVQDFYAQEYINPETGLVMLGDIMLNVEQARQQAEEYGHSFAREACYLCVHSVLHLLGYDHMLDADKQVMRTREEEIMNEFGLAR